MKINHPIDPYNWINLLYRADCKFAIQHLIDNQIEVDLIYLDPPFNSNRNYNIIYKSEKDGSSKAVQKAFHDMWSMTSQTRQLVLDFKEKLDTTKELSLMVRAFLEAWINSVLEDEGKDHRMIVYLIYMTERLLLMKRVLKETGSIYLHCDSTSSHYLKIIMDGIFGRDNFVNEIIWCYKSGGASKRHWSKKHDVILFYARKNKFKIFNQLKEKSYNREYKKYGFSKGMKEYKDIECDMCKKELPKNIGWHTYIGMRDVWEINVIGRSSAERMGYPTQKPLALLDRIIKASCPKDGIVLDPFCGCGTTLESAIRNNKKWIGIDVSNNALDIIKFRIENIGFPKEDYGIIYGNPDTLEEYNRLDPYQKQEWLINAIGGFCNPSKSGDGGVDGELTVHGGFDGNRKDIWHRAIFSVKTGKQSKPEFIRELIGTMKMKGAEYGGLILDKDPSDKMMAKAFSQKKIKYQYEEKLPPQYFGTVQILTSQQIMDGAEFNLPPSINTIREYRKKQHRLFQNDPN